MNRLVAVTMLAAAATPLCAQRGEGVEMQKGASDPAVRCVIQGVPWIGFYRGTGAPQDDPFPGCVRAILQFRGEDPGISTTSGRSDPWHNVHKHVLGTSGLAFRLGFNSTAWDWEALELWGMTADPVPLFQDGLQSVGYSCEVLLRRDFAASVGVEQEVDYDEAAFRERIIASIRGGTPVIGIGVVGPPDCCLITGYDDGGQVLIGRSYFQNEGDFAAGLEFEEAAPGDPDLYFRKRDWFADTRGLVVVNEKQPRPSEREIRVKALRRGLEIMRTPVVRGHWAGQAAFTMWADTLLRDGLFIGDDATARRRRLDVHHSAGGTLAEARAYGADFLRGLAGAEPAAAGELLEAARCFNDEHDLVWAIWEFTGGMITNDVGAETFDKGYIRRRIVPLIRIARGRDAEAAEHIQRALELMGDGTSGTLTPGTFGRAVLEGAPRIGYGVHSCPFPGSLCAVLEYLGDPVDYDYLMGACGAAFRRLWNRDDGGNVDLSYLAPRPFDLAADAAGYELRVVPRHEARMLEAIQLSIARGRPVIGFGIIGPPEAGVITGYSSGGEVLHGWSYFQAAELKDYYEDRGWFEKFDRFSQAPDAGLGPVDTEPVGLVLVGDKMSRGMSKRDATICSLEYAIDLARTPERPHLPDHVSGLAAYEAWAAALEVDADYPADDAKVMELRIMVHGDQCTMLSERRSAAAYLRRVADAEPGAADQLRSAADLYDQVADLGPSLWFWGGGGPTVADALKDPQKRREMAGHVRTAAAAEAQAVEHLEQALEAIKAAPAG